VAKYNKKFMSGKQLKQKQTKQRNNRRKTCK